MIVQLRFSYRSVTVDTSQQRKRTFGGWKNPASLFFSFFSAAFSSSELRVAKRLSESCEAGISSLIIFPDFASTASFGVHAIRRLCENLEAGNPSLTIFPDLVSTGSCRVQTFTDCAKIWRPEIPASQFF